MTSRQFHGWKRVDESLLPASTQVPEQKVLPFAPQHWLQKDACVIYFSLFLGRLQSTSEMNNISFGRTTTAPTRVPCVVNETYFPHLFLIPAGIIITILAFLRKRTSFKKDVWDGRPGLVVPMDFIGNDHDRLAIMCVFGAATGSIVNLIVGSYAGDNVWEAAFLGIGAALEVAFLYYPYFGCLASYHRIIGALMGLPYVVVYFFISTTTELQKCNYDGEPNWAQYFVAILPNIPTMLCQLFIMGKFVLVLYKEIKEYGISTMQLFTRDDDLVYEDMKLVRPWLLDYVKDLVNSKPARQYSGIQFCLRKIYNPERNFKFSTQSVSVVMICCILLYNISFKLVFIFSAFLDRVSDAFDNGNLSELVAKFFRGLLGSMLAATLLTTIFCMVSLIRFMENHKNNMLRMFKGDKSFIPKTFSASQFMIGKGLRYPSYQIGYFLWGYFLLLLLFTVICGLFSALILSKTVQGYVVKYLKGGGVLVGVAVFTALLLPLASFTVFRDYNYSKDVISLNNRNVYMVFSYFWFFVGLPMGFFSAISRILKAMIVGALMLPRIDHSVMPDGFQQIDQGFNAYICSVRVQTAYRNPILRVFCQILSDETQKDNNTVPKWKCSAQARARWFLALTLTRNPQLASDRKPDVQGEHSILGSIEIQVGQLGSDNVGLIQDK